MALVGSVTPEFVRLWVGAEHFDGLALTWATAAALAVFGFVCFFGWLLDTQGDARRRLASSTAGAAINLGLSVWWARQWGVAGVACGTLAAYLLTDVWYLPRLAVRLYGLSGRALAAACGGALVRGGAGAALVVAAARMLPPAGSWSGLIADCAWLGTAAGVYCWFLVLRAADRAAWQARWRELRRRRAAGSAA
jgi:O-antigen/teichoic acid export membrane protein